MTVSIEETTLLDDKILAYETEFGARKTKAGIFLKDDEMTVAGARPRWAKVLAVGPKVTDIRAGQYILVEHARWTRGFLMLKDNKKITARMIDNACILLVSDEPTDEYQLSEKI